MQPFLGNIRQEENLWHCEDESFAGIKTMPNKPAHQLVKVHAKGS